MLKQKIVTSTSELKRAQVLYDGECALCRKSVSMLKRLDWLSRLTYADARNEQEIKSVVPALHSERLLQEMHVRVPKTGKVYHGFGAFRWLAWRLPAMWPLAPLLYVPGVPSIGQRLYLWIARNRFRLVPCHGGVCTLPVDKRSGQA